MAFSLETKEGLERKLTISVPAQTFEKEEKNQLEKLATQVKLDGFRPGKVPMRIVRERFGKSVKADVIETLIKDSLKEAIQEEKLNVAGTPNVEVKSYEAGKPFEYSATFEVMPEFEVKDLADVSVEKIVADVTEKDIENTIETIRKQHAKWIQVDRAAADGDRLNIAFEGFVDGEPLKNGKSENFDVVLGAKQMISGFEEGLIGAEKGKSLDLNLTFPEKYHDNSVAGKPVHFKVTVNTIQEPELPALDDDFVKNFDIKEGGLDALKQELKSTMQRELERAVTARNKDKVFTLLLEQNPIEIPHALIDREIEQLQHQFQQQFSQYAGKKPANIPPAPKELFEEKARRRVALGLIVSKYVDTHHMEVEPKRLEQLLENLAANYDDKAEVINWYKSNRHRMAELEAMAMEDQVVDKLLENATIEEKTESYQAVMQSTKE